MFQPNKMNNIDNFFMRNNNQVTPKRSYSPRLTQQMNENSRGQGIQFFPCNKQNNFPNRVSISPNKVNMNRKPMIGGISTQAPSLLVSPRSKSPLGLNMNNNNNMSNQGYNTQTFNCYQQQHQQSRPLSINIKNIPSISNQSTQSNQFHQNQLNVPFKRSNQNNQIQFVMSKGVAYCENHLNKIAEFSINIEGENMVYCSICASKLASQGFPVTKLINQSSQKSTQLQTRKPKPLPNYQQYRGNPFYEQIMIFLKQLVNVQTNHYQVIQKYSILQQHYQHQIQITSQYYEQALKTLQQMKDQHINDLVLQKQKYLQIADIQNQQLNQNIQEINYMREDIQTNIPSIVTDIQEESFKQCVYEYRQKMNMLKHSVQEKEESFKDVTTYHDQQLKVKGEHFENAIKKLWEEDNPQTTANNRDQYKNNNKQQQVTLKNMHQMLPQASLQPNNNPGAFRHLFGDDSSDQTLPIPSPQFKKI